jgi:DNA repair protein RadC
MLNQSEKIAVKKAIKIIESKALVSDLIATKSCAVKDYCQLQIALSEREKFCVLYLNNQHHLISFEIMFEGTVDSAAVYPREIAKQALKLNSNSLILCHNHPSGILSPSIADKTITDKLVKALSLLDIKVLDHIIVSPNGSFSFAENGLL